jgi:hypothetical protein
MAGLPGIQIVFWGEELVKRAGNIRRIGYRMDAAYIASIKDGNQQRRNQGVFNKNKQIGNWIIT